MPGGVPMAWMRSLYRHAPVVAVRGSGSRFEDLDGNAYLDFNACDLAMPAGFAPEPIVRAIHDQALLGNHFLLPTIDAVEVCRLLAERFGLPQWQFTLSATGANTDALRIARVATGRSTVLVFDGKYHGRLDRTLSSRRRRRSHGRRTHRLNPSTAQTTDVIPYNDPDGLRTRLAHGDIAAVLVESALTNCGLVLPTPEFVASLNTDVPAAGAVLIVDETHVQFAVHGGGTAVFGFEPDMLTGGKGIGGGVPIGVIGMTDAIADVVSANRDHDPGLVETGDGTASPSEAPCMPTRCPWRLRGSGSPRSSPKRRDNASTTWVNACRRGCSVRSTALASVDHRPARWTHPIPPHPRATPHRRRQLRLARPAPRRRAQGLPAQPRYLGCHRHRRALGLLRHRRGRGRRVRERRR